MAIRTTPHHQKTAPRPAGRPVRRSPACRTGRLGEGGSPGEGRGVVAIIERDGKILMQRRSEHIADPGTWVLPGGEVRNSERAHDALARVCGEELGITVHPSKEIGTMDLPDHPCPVWHVIWKGKEVKLGGKDITGVGWFTVEELLELEPVRYQEELRGFLRSNETLSGICRRAPQGHPTDGTTEEAAGQTLEETSVDQQTVLTLVRRAQAGDHEAFGEIYDRFVTPIHRYVAFRLPAALAEDIVADVFVKAWEKLDRYKGRAGTPFSSWLFRIAHNVVVDAYRAQKDAVMEPDELRMDEDRWNDPTLKVTQDLQCALLRGAMGKLPRRYREVLLLTFMSDLTHGEAAKAMHIREGSVRMLKHRALRKLAEFLPASMRDELP